MKSKLRKQSLSFTIIVVAAIVVVSFMYSEAFAYCTPQCVPFARNLSGKGRCCFVGANGSAIDWYNCEKGQGHTKSASDKPKKGRVIILDKSIGKYGHAVYIDSVGDGDDGKYPIKISQSNAQNRASGTCDQEYKIKATYNKNKKTLKYKDGYLKNKTYSVKGYIVK